MASLNPAPPAVWRHVPNALSLARIVCAPVLVLMAAAALLSGHFLGGSEPVARHTIAIANATRNAGLAIALIGLNFPQAKHAVLTTIATYAVISAIAGAIYTRFYLKRQAPSAESHPASGL